MVSYFTEHVIEVVLQNIASPKVTQLIVFFQTIKNQERETILYPNSSFTRNCNVTLKASQELTWHCSSLKRNLLKKKKNTARRDFISWRILMNGIKAIFAANLIELLQLRRNHISTRFKSSTIFPIRDKQEKVLCAPSG